MTRLPHAFTPSILYIYMTTLYAAIVNDIWLDKTWFCCTTIHSTLLLLYNAFKQGKVTSTNSPTWCSSWILRVHKKQNTHSLLKGAGRYFINVASFHTLSLCATNGVNRNKRSEFTRLSVLNIWIIKNNSMFAGLQHQYKNKRPNAKTTSQHTNA